MSDAMNNNGNISGSDACNSLLAVADLQKEYRMGRNTVPVLHGLTFEISAGEMVSVMGASGAGKTTLLYVLGGLDRPTGGKVFFDGQDLYGVSAGQRTNLRSKRMGFVFQAYYLLPELNVLENVELPAMSIPGGRRAVARERAAELLSQVGLGDRLSHHPSELSGGEQQRAAIARALMNDPEIIFADEPTGNLDSETGGHVLDCLFELVREREHTLVVVTHDEAVAERCDRKLQLCDGRLKL